MTLPNPSEWEVTSTRLGKACRGVYSHVADYRRALENVTGGYVNERTRRELAALDEFIAACKAEGLDKTGT